MSDSQTENDLSEELPSVDELFEELMNTKDEDAEAFSKNKKLFQKVLEGVHGAIFQATTLKNKRPKKMTKKIATQEQRDEQESDHVEEAGKRVT